MAAGRAGDLSTFLIDTFNIYFLMVKKENKLFRMIVVHFRNESIQINQSRTFLDSRYAILLSNFTGLQLSFPAPANICRQIVVLFVSKVAVLIWYSLFECSKIVFYLII